MKYPEGSIIINKSGERRKVIGVCGDARFLETVGEEKLYTPSTYSVTNLEERGYVEEAPRWEPKEELWWLEEAAAIEHDRWAKWQKHVHGLSTRNSDGTITIPIDCVSRWERQINTSYECLSEEEKESDRKEALRYSQLFAEAARERVKKALRGSA